MADEASEEADEGGAGLGPVPRRDGYGRWLPGQTGNSAGRPAVVGPIRDLARAYTSVAVLALVDVARSSLSPPAARVAAARELLDRAHGRPQAGEPMVRPVEVMSDADLDAAMAVDAALIEAGELVGLVCSEGPIVLDDAPGDDALGDDALGEDALGDDALGEGLTRGDCVGSTCGSGAWGPCPAGPPGR